MTIYCTREDFEEAFTPRELAELIAAGADYERQAEAAGSVIDGYIGARYALPLASVPSILRAWALDVTRYRLWSDQAPEEIRRRYEDALAQLRDLAAGRIDLPPGVDGIPQAGTPFVTDGYAAERVFTMDTLKGF